MQILYNFFFILFVLIRRASLLKRQASLTGFRTYKGDGLTQSVSKRSLITVN